MEAVKIEHCMDKISFEIASHWQGHLGKELEQDYMKDLRSFLQNEVSLGKQIYPNISQMFSAFNATSFDDVKVVILGQDPYHGPDQAHGLCFSVPPGVKIPPSLRNIYKELEHDLKIAPVDHGYLQSWAEQGVLMLNATLSVEAHKAGSHQKKGWEKFTDQAIEILNKNKENLVFILWGSYAHKKGQHIDQDKHLVLKAVHPSPLSAHRGFIGCGHFSSANIYLKKHGLKPINWQLPLRDEL